MLQAETAQPGGAAPAAAGGAAPAAPAAPQNVGAASIMGARGAATTAMATSKQGLTVTGSADGVLQMWMTGYGACVATVPDAHAGGVSCLAADAGALAELVLSGGADGSLRAWALHDGAPRGGVVAHAGALHCLAAARDGVRVYTGGADGALRLWIHGEDCAFTPASSAAPRGGSATSALTHLVLSRGEDTLYAGHACGAVHAWRAADLGPLRAFAGHAGRLTALALSREGDLLASAAAGDGAVRLWRTADAEEAGCAHVLTADDAASGAPDVPTALAVGSDGAAVFVGYASGAVRAWRAATGACTHSLAAPPPAPAVTALALSRNDERLAVGGADGVVRMARAGDLAPTHSLVGHREAAAFVAISKDGREVLAAGAEGVLRKWNVGSQLGFSRTACLTVNARTPGCIPGNLTKVLSQLATSAGAQITPARRAQAAAAVTAAVGAATHAVSAVALAVTRDRRDGASPQSADAARAEAQADAGGSATAFGGAASAGGGSAVSR